jgi:hypothetical protein
MFIDHRKSNESSSFRSEISQRARDYISLLKELSLFLTALSINIASLRDADVVASTLQREPLPALTLAASALRSIVAPNR